MALLPFEIAQGRVLVIAQNHDKLWNSLIGAYFRGYEPQENELDGSLSLRKGGTFLILFLVVHDEPERIGMFEAFVPCSYAP